MTESHDQKLKVSLHYTVGKMCEEQAANIQVNFNKQMIGTINEFVWKQLKLITKDLEAFAKHGKRSTVNIEDVKLLVRRNEDLKAKLETIATSNTEESKADRTKATRKRKLEPAAVETVSDFDSVDLDVFS